MNSMTIRKKLLLLAMALLFPIAVCCFVYYVVIFDPFDWGPIQSRHFIWEKFSTVREGETISSVIERLGEPVETPTPYTAMTSDVSDPCRSGTCKKYLFASAAWGASFKEAIVITDSRGYVLHAEARQE
jgi:hypothetical protein